MPSDDVFWHHQVKIAKSTLKMNDVGVAVMGGMTKNGLGKFSVLMQIKSG